MRVCVNARVETDFRPRFFCVLGALLSPSASVSRFLPSSLFFWLAVCEVSEGVELSGANVEVCGKGGGQWGVHGRDE